MKKSVSYFCSSSHTVVGLHDPLNFYLEHLFSTCTHLFLSGFQSNLYLNFSYAPLMHGMMVNQKNNFQHEANTLMYLRGTITLYVDNSITWTPSNDLRI